MDKACRVMGCWECHGLLDDLSRPGTSCGTMLISMRKKLIACDLTRKKHVMVSDGYS